jgi:hypothetical protein
MAANHLKFIVFTCDLSFAGRSAFLAYSAGNVSP